MEYFHNFKFNFLIENYNLSYSIENITHLNEIVYSCNDCLIFKFNIRSITKHFDEFIVFLSSCDFVFDIIYLCETWLKADTLKFEIDSYINYNYYRQLNKFLYLSEIQCKLIILN